MTAIAVADANAMPFAGSLAAGGAAVHAAARDRVRLAAIALRNWLGARRSAARPVRNSQPSRIEMPLEAQWINVSRVVERAIRRGQTVAQLHAAASLRIDSTEYEIGLLKHDLAGVLGGQRGAKA